MTTKTEARRIVKVALKNYGSVRDELHDYPDDEQLRQEERHALRALDEAIDFRNAIIEGRHADVAVIAKSPRTLGRRGRIRTSRRCTAGGVSA